MMTRHAFELQLLAAVVFSWACEPGPPTAPTALPATALGGAASAESAAQPSAVTQFDTSWSPAVKGGQDGGGDALIAEVLVGDSACPASPSSLASRAPGDVTDNYHVRWGHTQGLIVTPDGSSYALTDDVTLNMRLRQNDMTLTSVTLWGQDVIGPEGIMHNTDAIPITPQPVAQTGFTLHVHATGVTVYRLSGHIGGKRVGPIGTVCIGDVVYRQP